MTLPFTISCLAIFSNLRMYVICKKRFLFCETNILWSSRTGVFFRHFQLPNPATPIRYHSKIVFVSIMFSLFIQIKPLGNNEDIGRLKTLQNKRSQNWRHTSETFCFKTLRLRFWWWKLTILKTMLSASIKKKRGRHENYERKINDRFIKRRKILLSI